MEPKDKDAGQYSGWWLLGIAALGACALAVAYWAGWSPSGPDENAAAKLGQMGDFFGGMLNPLVSALTLFVAIRVWRFQEKELQATQKALDEQAKTAEQQRQEQRFFDLLNVYQRTVESITHTQSPHPLSQTREVLYFHGKQAISEWLKRNTLDNSALGLNGFKLQETNANGTWLKFDAPGHFNHYFRVVFRILSEAEALLGDQHIRYIELFHAQLSRSELIILAYNVWLDDEGKKMIPLAEKYGLLKHLPNGYLRTELEKLHPKVFGRNRAQLLQALPPTQPEASL
jgi:hypothetical protein